MKITIFAFLAFFLLNGYCMSQQPKLEEIDSNTPDWVNDLPPEGVFWGIGTGKLSTVEASCELAKFNAQAAMIRSISYRAIDVLHSTDQPLQYDLVDQLNVYKNEFYYYLMLTASEQVSFELSEFTKIERRARTADGTVWYLISLEIDDLKKIGAIDNYIDEYFESHIAEIEAQIIKTKVERTLDELFDMLRNSE